MVYIDSLYNVYYNMSGVVYIDSLYNVYYSMSGVVYIDSLYTVYYSMSGVVYIDLLYNVYYSMSDVVYIGSHCIMSITACQMWCILALTVYLLHHVMCGVYRLTV